MPPRALPAILAGFPQIGSRPGMRSRGPVRDVAPSMQCRSGWLRVPEVSRRHVPGVGRQARITLLQSLLDVAGGCAAIDPDEFTGGRMVLGASAHEEFPEFRAGKL